MDCGGGETNIAARLEAGVNALGRLEGEIGVAVSNESGNRSAGADLDLSHPQVAGPVLRLFPQLEIRAFPTPDGSLANADAFGDLLSRLAPVIRQ
jgi:hypothetical protein